MVLVQFRCETGRIFRCDKDIFKKSPIIQSMLEDFGIGQGLPPGVNVDPIVIPLPNLTEEVLWAVITWCEHHKDEPDKTEQELHDAMFSGVGEVSEWDKRFLASLEEENSLFDLLVASKYLGIPEMMDMLTTFVANAIVNPPPEEGEEAGKTEDKPESEGAVGGVEGAVGGVEGAVGGAIGGESPDSETELKSPSDSDMN